MIPECACLRHDCSCPAAVEAAPPLVLAQMHGGLDSSRRLAIRLGSPVWRLFNVVREGRLLGLWACPAVVTPLWRMRFRLW